MIFSLVCVGICIHVFLRFTVPAFAFKSRTKLRPFLVYSKSISDIHFSVFIFWTKIFRCFSLKRQYSVLLFFRNTPSVGTSSIAKISAVNGIFSLHSFTCMVWIRLFFIVFLYIFTDESQSYVDLRR